MILVTVNWRGALNIERMRTFSEKKEARTYYDDLVGADAGKWHLVRGYETFKDSEPVLIWSSAKDKKNNTSYPLGYCPSCRKNVGDRICADFELVWRCSKCNSVLGNTRY